MCEIQVDGLALRELEALAGALLTVLFPLARAGVAGQIAHSLKLAAEFDIELTQSPSDTETDGTSLSVDSATIGENQHVELVGCLGSQQRLFGGRTGRVTGEILIERFPVDDNIAATIAQKHTGHGGLTPTGAEPLS